MPRTLRIAVLEKDRERALMIVDGLREQGDYDVVVFGDETGLARKLAAANPDVVLIDLENPNRDMLEEMALASSPLERPVAMFTDSSNEELTRAAIEAGVSAYVVDGLQKDRIKPIIDAAIARFHMVTRMRTVLATTRPALKERKTLDRAKGILMSARKCDEAEAYKILRKAAMDQGKKVGDVAAALVASAELLR